MWNDITEQIICLKNTYFKVLLSSIIIIIIIISPTGKFFKLILIGAFFIELWVKVNLLGTLWLFTVF